VVSSNSSFEKDKQRTTKEEFEDITGLIRIRKKEKNRQHDGQKKEVKRANNRSQKKSLKIPQG
jgi:hypothetical protein